MTRSNIKQRNDPFLLSPAGKDYIWGGRRLKDEFAKDLDMDPLAETWECSAHPDGPSIVASGPFSGRTLPDVLREYPEMLGTDHGKDGKLPILVKLIDAAEDLSVQVHPDGTYAREHENGETGKTELWYVLDAAEDTCIVYGLKHDMDRDGLLRCIRDGSIEEHLRKVRIRKGDVFFIPPGTIHAIGAGALIAEIQENSNITYRLYDYGRKDRNGSERCLHIDRAMDTACLNASHLPRRPVRLFRCRKGCMTESLCRCRYFDARKIRISAPDGVQIQGTDERSFGVFLCIEGSGELKYTDGSLPFSKGSCIFLPAGNGTVSVYGRSEMIKITC